MKIFNKVKCNICGKVGLRNMPKALAGHLRLAHNIFTKEIDSYFDETSSDEIVDLKPSTKRERRKVDTPKGKSKSSRFTILKTPAKVIYTPMGNKR